MSARQRGRIRTHTTTALAARTIKPLVRGMAVHLADDLAALFLLLGFLDDFRLAGIHLYLAARSLVVLLMTIRH